MEDSGVSGCAGTQAATPMSDAVDGRDEDADAVVVTTARRTVVITSVQRRGNVVTSRQMG